MGQAAGIDESDQSIAWPPAFGKLIVGSQAWLAERGDTILGSGCVRSRQLSGSLHSDFGPEDQDKDANQDYALAWLPHEEETRQRFRFAVALGDGLTTSFRSEWASALVCSVALRALVEGNSGLGPIDLARHAFNQAGERLGRLADEMAQDPAASCPPGQFLSTWKYILRKGLLLQSTLTLAWLDRHFLRVAMLGDGGGVCRSYRPPSREPRPKDRVLAQCDLDQHHVRAIGPADRRVYDFDCWHEQELNRPFLCALYTDGIGRGIGGKPIALLDELEKLQAGGAENPAREFIEQAVDARPQNFGDNLTLAVVGEE
jgi:hypothetical protein